MPKWICKTKIKIKAHDVLFTGKLPHFNSTQKLRVGKWKQILHANQKQKGAGVAMGISDEIIYRSVVKHNKGHCTVIRGSIQQEETAIVSICAHVPRAPSIQTKYY